MFWKRSQEGYLLIDHRASPGLSEADARACGYDPSFCGEGKRYEVATLTCAHCKCAVVKTPFRQQERASCPKCNYHFICDFCAASMAQPDYDHTPFDKLRDAILNEAARQSYCREATPSNHRSPQQMTTSSSNGDSKNV